MIRSVTWTTGSYAWDSRDDDHFLDKKTAALLRVGELVMAQSRLIRSNGSKEDIGKASSALYDAKRAAIAILEEP